MITVGVCLVPFGTTYAQAREAAQRLDTLGFDSVWLWDHYVSWDDPRESVLECWTTLSGLAEATRRIKLAAHTLCIALNRLLGNPDWLRIKHLAFPS
jgi:alkanesulfonate monooxygenase SsuD/methylene tetrahydromethanopterin reductase-like flavin-dependent oxidoreductase (luciferase family)